MALLQDGDALRLPVQPRVLDRYRGLGRERRHGLLVLARELGDTLLLGQVQVPDGLTAPEDGRAEKAAHRRVVGRKANRGRVLLDVAQTQGVWLALEESEEAQAVRQGSDEGALLRRDARGDELLHGAGRVEDAERGVFRARDVAGLIDHALQHGGAVELGGHRHPRGVECCQPGSLLTIALLERAQASEHDG